MPSEAAIKAQIAAALAKKKQQAAPPAPPSEPKIEIKLNPPVEMANSSTPVIPATPPPVATPTVLIFGGRAIRFTTYQKEVHFALGDLLPLSRDHEWNNKFIDFVNNPKTKKDAEELVKILTFKNDDGSDKTEGATAANVIKIFHTLELQVPGPLGRWLTEVSTIHRT